MGKPEFRQLTFEPAIQNTIDMNGLDTQAVLSFLGTDSKPTEIHTCIGDVYKVINMLYDYAKILDAAIEQWELEGYHRISYELHAQSCRHIAEKFSAAIGYDYEKALKKCRKKQERGSKVSDIGGDALTLATR